MKKLKALYAGSFDPLTNGHLDLIERAARTYDSVTIGVIKNMSKAPYFSIPERMEMIKKVVSKFDNVEVASFTGLLADYVNENGFNVVLRGLRGNMDFEYELQMAHMNARLYENNVETVFLMTDPQYSFVSSSMAKEVHMLGGDITGLVPDEILSEMDKKRNAGGR